MLAAPIVSAGTGFKHLGSQKVWFPPGRWFGWFDGEEHQAGVTETISADLNSFPLFVRGGYPLLTENYTERMTGSNPNQILIKIYPGNNGDHFQTDLYEDDGETKGYLSGDYALTHVETQTAQNGQTMDVTLAPQLSTQLDHIPAARSYVLQVMSDQALKSVMVDGQAVSTQYDESNGMTSIQTPHQSAKVTIVY
jgi:alpha-glucosidase (family GH31 glycosyl hydrolase)